VRYGRRTFESGRVTVPTRIIWGKRDAFLRAEMAQESLNYCDNGQLTYFDKATHWLHHEEPGRVNEMLLEFFAKPART
jgi:pimeloyl-ACP methyl ester carboxylesterase